MVIYSVSKYYFSYYT